MNKMFSPNDTLRERLSWARFPFLHSVGLAALVFAASSTALAQDPRDGRRRGGDSGGDRGGNPQDFQARMMTTLRDRLGVTNDDEWAVISDRLTKVMEVRRNSGGGMGGFLFGGRGSSGGDSKGGSSRGSRSGSSTEVAALQAAVVDKLPDAEIKARLDRVRELRKENEVKLAKAQEDLRAVLSVRQEAMMVLAGLLP